MKPHPKIKLTELELEQLSHCMEFCINQGFCMGMKEEYKLYYSNIVKKIEEALKK